MEVVAAIRRCRKAQSQAAHALFVRPAFSSTLDLEPAVWHALPHWTVHFDGAAPFPAAGSRLPGWSLSLPFSRYCRPLFWGDARCLGTTHLWGALTVESASE